MNKTTTHTKNKETKKESAKKKKQQKKKIPYQYKPEGLDLKTWQILLRKQVAKEEKLTISCIDETNAPGEYRVQNPKTRQEYKVTYRGAKSPWNYCSCMDFKTSQLGTCKHIEAVKSWFGKRHHVRREIPSYTSVYLDYSGERCVRIRIGSDNEEQFRELASQYFDGEMTLKPEAFKHFSEFLKQARSISDTFRCYHDALQFVLDIRERTFRQQWVDSLTQEDFKHLLRTSLYPYQEEGIRFAAKAGRAIIADEMGLGKTIQAIGTAELLRGKGLAGSILILCPTSLKYQWKREIERFTGQKVHVIEGSHMKRREQYNREEPYKIVSYNAVSNDIRMLGSIDTDMLIIDEVQRLKNWNTQISATARRIESDYAVILSGTPLENRLEELYSVMEFVDNFCLAPYYLFRDRYIITDEKGATVGYRNLNEIGTRLAPHLIRRKKSSVRLQMPARQDKNLMVPMTKEQMAVHDECRMQVSRLMQKWERMHFLSETDRNRLILLLSQMRMVCDSTYILDQKTRYDTKIGEVINIISNVMDSGEEKIVIFSQWERMTRLIAKEMDDKGIGYEYLYGGVPSKARKNLVDNFTDNPGCRVFLSTDAGSTGLNLQAASIIINMDLPWNPAVLEQRIARIYRLGQQKNIQVINMVSANTFEEEMLGKLKFKSSLFEGVLDGGEDTIFATDSKFKKMMEELSQTMNSSENTSSEEEQPIDKNEEEKPVDDTSIVFEQEHETTGTEAVTTDTETNATSTETANAGTERKAAIQDSENRDITAGNPADAPHPQRHDAKKLVEQGVSFLSGLTEMLKSPQATKHLIDTIVEENQETGETHIRIPVPDRNTVVKFLDAITGLLSSQGK